MGKANGKTLPNEFNGLKSRVMRAELNTLGMIIFIAKVGRVLKYIDILKL